MESGSRESPKKWKNSTFPRVGREDGKIIYDQGTKVGSDVFIHLVSRKKSVSVFLRNAGLTVSSPRLLPIVRLHRPTFGVTKEEEHPQVLET